jgi:excisionase family DNA binding protein
MTQYCFIKFCPIESARYGLRTLNEERNGSVPISPQATPVIADRWLSVDEVAQYLGVKRDTIYKWIQRRRMPAHKVSRLWKFRKQEVDDWVCSERTEADVPESDLKPT